MHNSIKCAHLVKQPVATHGHSTSNFIIKRMVEYEQCHLSMGRVKLWTISCSYVLWQNLSGRSCSICFLSEWTTWECKRVLAGNWIILFILLSEGWCYVVERQSARRSGKSEMMLVLKYVSMEIQRQSFKDCVI
jgi:hypothetical protein